MTRPVATQLMRCGSLSRSLCVIATVALPLSWDLIVSGSALAGRGRVTSAAPQQPSANPSPTTAAATVLELGKPIERELAGGQSHSYQITLSEGQLVSMVVEQRGIDVMVKLFGPDGKQITEFDSEIRKQGQEPVSLAAEASGNYQIDVHAGQLNTPAGRYEIRVIGLRAATEKDYALQEARSLNTRSRQLYLTGNYDAVLPLAERVLEIRERALGPSHPEVAASLNNLALLHSSRGDYAKSETLYQRALAIREEALGPEHLEVADTLNSLANFHTDRGRYASAEPLLQRALKIREKWLGPDHPNVAQSINNLARLHHSKSDYANAEPLYERALAIKEKVFGPEHVEVANSLHNLAVLYYHKGDYVRSEPLHRRALVIREKVFGPEHPSVASSLSNLASLYHGTGDYAEELPLLQRALAIREKALGPKHPAVATSLNNLAIFYLDTGDHARAEPLYQRALAIREEVLGPEHPDVAASLNNLVLFYRARGNYPKAEEVCQRALALNEKLFGPEHLQVASPLHNLAILYHETGNYGEAEVRYQRAVAIKEKALGTGHPGVATLLDDFSSLYYDTRDYFKAEPLMQRALTIRERQLGPEHPDVANSLNNLAILYRTKGDYARAELLYQRALAIQEKILGAEHPSVALSLNNLATLYYRGGDLAKTESLYQRALTIREKALGPEHPDVATSLYNLAQLHVAGDNLGQAVAMQLRASRVSESNIVLNLSAGSERQKLAYLATLSVRTDQTISLHVQAAVNDPIACSLAATTILQRKGRILDAVSDSLSLLRSRFDAQDQALLDQFKDTNAQLARLVLGGPQRTIPAEHQKRIKDLEEQKEKLEAEISRRSAEFRVQAQPITLDAVRAVIPDNAALIEFAAYRPFNPKASKESEAYGESRYVAYILRREGEIQWQELGEAKAIDGAVDALRRALRDPKRQDVKDLSRALDAQVMQPLRALLGETRHLLVSPDGALNLIPFAALVDERGRYLVERYSFNYLTSGRDLLRLQAAQESRSAPLVVANPDFGEPEMARTARADVPRPRPPARARTRQSVTTGADLSNVYFGALRASDEEARAIKALFPQAAVLTRGQATEAALKQAAAPQILHIATHGFFLEDQPVKIEGTRGDGGLRGLSANAKVENPLLRSGLALAGANLRPPGGDDGLLTALEAAGLNLWGTRLVVLSACDTGLGEVRTGEGVYGLRRALVLAGAETQVMSLWAVSDRVTRELMTAYYAGLRQGQGRGEALRQVQLKMLQRPGREHPFYWASFIQSGEWAGLDGRR
jgi:CHAT domain-containing protein/tetratricopeptide (TPR) repeat protein